MSEILNEQWQQHIANLAEHHCLMAAEAIREAAAQHAAPSAVYRPKLSIDGDQWCALYGDDLQNGVAGFGKSPADAMLNFDEAWHKRLNMRGAAHA